MAGRGLVPLNQIANSLGISFAMTVADDGVGAAGGFDANVGPENTGRNMDGSDLGDRDALFVAAEQARLDPNDVQWTHDETSREEQIAFGPAAGDERFRLVGGHSRHLRIETSLSPRCGLGPFSLPTAYAVGFILTPLRGFYLARFG